MKRKGSANSVVMVCIVVIIFAAIGGGGFYAWKTGMFCGGAKEPDPMIATLTSQVNQAQSEAQAAQNMAKELSERLLVVEKLLGIGEGFAPSVSTDMNEGVVPSPSDPNAQPGSSQEPGELPQVTGQVMPPEGAQEPPVIPNSAVQPNPAPTDGLTPPITAPAQ